MSRFIIVSAINDYYLPLLIDLLRSLRDCKTSFPFDIGILDVGLSERSLQQITPFDVIVKKPGIDVDYPSRVRWEQENPYFRAMTSRPSLPSYFPGYDAYMWMDADTWVQTPEALEVMLTSAVRDENLYIVPEFDFDYPAALSGGVLWQEWLTSFQNCFPTDVAMCLSFRPVFNVGVFALSAKAPHWRRWHETLKWALMQIPEMEKKHFVMEQLCLNLAVYRENLGLKIMPAEYNWITVLGLPAWDEKARLYVRPTPPHRPLSIVHLAAQIKNSTQTIRTTQGQILQRPLTYAAVLADRIRAQDSPPPRGEG